MVDILALQHAAGVLAQDAGEQMMAFYRTPHKAEMKADHSPVTEADLLAHRLIHAGLLALTPDIPIVSEENDHAVDIASAPYFWLVDPLDGTRSFVRGSGDFTVNIALVHNDFPILGVIYAPLEHTLYVGCVGHGAWRKTAEEKDFAPISVRTATPAALRVLVSHHHSSPNMDRFLQNYIPEMFGDTAHMAVRDATSSSIKFCRVAEGLYDCYPRLGPTMEWDSAAGQAIVEAAGGRVLTLEHARFHYRKPEFSNTPFVVLGT